MKQQISMPVAIGIAAIVLVAACVVGWMMINHETVTKVPTANTVSSNNIPQQEGSLEKPGSNKMARPNY
jgi:hypothetical protein